MHKGQSTLQPQGVIYPEERLKKVCNYLIYSYTTIGYGRPPSIIILSSKHWTHTVSPLQAETKYMKKDSCVYPLVSCTQAPFKKFCCSLYLLPTSLLVLSHHTEASIIPITVISAPHISLYINECGLLFKFHGLWVHTFTVLTSVLRDLFIHPSSIPSFLHMPRFYLHIFPSHTFPSLPPHSHFMV